MGPTTVESGPLAVDPRVVKQESEKPSESQPGLIPRLSGKCHVPSLLLAQEQEAAPGVYQDRSPGSIGGAVWYMDMARIGWTQTDDALAWSEELALRAYLLPPMK